MGYQVIIEPAVEVVTLAQCKAAARLTATALDSLIEDYYIPAARRLCEQRCERSLITQTLRKTLDAFPASGDIELLYGPVQSIASIHYVDDAGATQAASPSIYALDDRDSVRSAWALLLNGQSWPAAGGYANAVSVQYVAGYGNDAASVPAELRLWVMAAVAEMIRSGAPDLPRGFAAGLLDRAAAASV